MLCNASHSSAARRTRARIQRTFILAALAIVLAAPTTASADAHAACARCGRWVVISKEGFGFLRNHFVVCGKCLDRAGKDLREKFHDTNNRLNEKRRQKPSYDAAAKKKQQDLNDHVSRQRDDHKNRGFGYDKGWTRIRDGKQRDNRYDRLKKDLATAQNKSNTLNQQIKELEQRRAALAKQIP